MFSFSINQNIFLLKLQVCHLLEKHPNFLERLLDGTNVDLLAILLKWNMSAQANLLHVATELKNVKLLEVIFKKRENLAKECIDLGLKESIKYAAEKVYIRPLNFLLDKDDSPEEIFNTYIKELLSLRHY